MSAVAVSAEVEIEAVATPTATNASSSNINLDSNSAPPTASSEQLEIWREEQIHLSKQLILDDSQLGFSWNNNNNSTNSNNSSSSSSNSLPPLRLIGGVDISFVGSDDSLACAALVVLE